MQLNNDFSQNFDSPFTIGNLKEPERLEVDEFAKKCRVMGILIVSNTVELGPVIDYYYYDKGSYLAKKLAFDPAALTEVLILAKHTKFIRGIYKNKALVQQIDMKDEMDRKTFGYILIELDPRGSIRKAEKIAERLKDVFEKKSRGVNIRKEIEKALIDLCKDIKEEGH
ncbi:MAG: hypothetical protein ACP6IP_04610 [Candidatus Njordarchaeia archaeon]